MYLNPQSIMVMVCLYTEWHELLYISQNTTGCFPAFPFDLPMQILYTVQHSDYWVG